MGADGVGAYRAGNAYPGEESEVAESSGEQNSPFEGGKGDVKTV